MVSALTDNEDIARAATIVGAGAGMANDQMKAGPNASMTERAALGVSECMGDLGPLNPGRTMHTVTSRY